MIEIKNNVDSPMIDIIDTQRISLSLLVGFNIDSSTLRSQHTSRTITYFIKLLRDRNIFYQEEVMITDHIRGAIINFTHIIKVESVSFYMMIEEMIDTTLFTKDSIYSSSYYTHLRDKDLAKYPSQEELISQWVVCEEPIRSATLIMQLRDIFIIKKRHEHRQRVGDTLRATLSDSNYNTLQFRDLLVPDPDSTKSKEQEEQDKEEERRTPYKGISPIRKNVSLSDFTELSDLKHQVGLQIDEELRARENSTQRLNHLLSQLRPFEQELQSKRELLMEQVKRHERELAWYDKPYVPSNVERPLRPSECYSQDYFDKQEEKSSGSVKHFVGFLGHLFKSKDFWVVVGMIVLALSIMSAIYRHNH